MDWLLNGAIVLMASVGLLSSVLPVFGNVLYAPGSRYDFGSVKAGETVKHRFTVRNLHPWSVTVLDVQSDCGCTNAFAGRTPPFRLNPLEAAEIVAEMKTLGRHGHLSHSIAVATSDNPQSAQLSLQGEVR